MPETPKRDWLKLVGFRMTHGEYRANLDGLNIFFGAILGVVMTDIGEVNARVFGIILTIFAGYVITIIYISSSNRRIFYSVLALIGLPALWHLVNRLAVSDTHLNVAHFNARVFPTLLVWVVLTIIIEFTPREKREGE